MIFINALAISVCKGIQFLATFALYFYSYTLDYRWIYDGSFVICTIFLGCALCTLLFSIIPHYRLKNWVSSLSDRQMFFVYGYIRLVYGNRLGFGFATLYMVFGLFHYYVVLGLALLQDNVFLWEPDFLHIWINLGLFLIWNIINNLAMVIFSWADARQQSGYLRGNFSPEKREIILSRIRVFNVCRLGCHSMMGVFFGLHIVFKLAKKELLFKFDSSTKFPKIK